MFEIDIGSLDEKKLRIPDIGVLTGADFDGDVLSMKSFIDGVSRRYCLNDVLVTEELLRKQFKEDTKMNHKITLIGSMKNKDAMMDIYNRLTLRGNIVMLPYMGIIPEDADDDIIEQLHDIHREKMRAADFVVVVDTNGYIGKDTQAEIKWCESQDKRIIYASDFAMLDAPAKSKK